MADSTPKPINHSDPSTWPDPLQGYEQFFPLPPDTKNPDARSLAPPRPGPHTLSKTYETFPQPLQTSSRTAAFDIHIYHTTPAETEYARKLHTRIRLEFPEIRVYPFHDRPIGPHPAGMFELNVFTPAQLGALVGFLVIYRQGLKVLLHPNTGEVYGDHMVRAGWWGGEMELNSGVFRMEGLAGGRRGSRGGKAEGEVV
ncbi:hypothetical protein FGG08_003094 [Glutinoglossum americanum]|uniref:DOPA 4,5-dioxygenase n=1 Tax=Glutinoglossum americanum TaxID=1670608 RepID=A0A9P8I8C6_9PEZI|nr:hypothetical protein FGG08_003094 [Glutinoglossum americanum]